MKKFRNIIAFICIMFLILTVCLSSGIADGDIGAEQQMVSSTNTLRSSLGLPGLAVNESLADQARDWATQLAENGALFHDPNLAGSRNDYSALGENVGMGASIPSIFSALVASQSHYKNMVDSAYTEIGVGVVESGSTVFVVQRFRASRDVTPATVSTAPVSVVVEVVEVTTTVRGTVDTTTTVAVCSTQ